MTTTSNFLAKSLWAGLLAVGLAACSGDTVTNGLQQEAAVSAEARGYLTLSITPPAAESVTYGREVHTSAEASVYDLRVYFFQLKDEGDANNDADYLFTNAGKQTWKKEDGSALLGPTGTGVYSKRIAIPEGLENKKVKIMLLANDPNEEYTTEGTPLNTFKEQLWKNTLTTTASIYPSNEIVEINGQRRFPMSAMGEDYSGSGSGSEIITLTTGTDTPVQVRANLVRNVARLDILNDTPNLTITSAVLSNTPKQSYLFPKSPLETPSTARTVFYPISEYSTALPLSYATPGSGETAQQANTKTAFYMYEQPKATQQSTAPRVLIGYQLQVGDNTQSGTLNVYFRSNGAYIDLQRNYLYRIRLGDGTDVSGFVKVVFELVDWETQEILAVLDSNTDPADN